MPRDGSRTLVRRPTIDDVEAGQPADSESSTASEEPVRALVEPFKMPTRPETAQVRPLSLFGGPARIMHITPRQNLPIPDLPIPPPLLTRLWGLKPASNVSRHAIVPSSQTHICNPDESSSSATFPDGSDISDVSSDFRQITGNGITLPDHVRSVGDCEATHSQIAVSGHGLARNHSGFSDAGSDWDPPSPYRSRAPSEDSDSQPPSYRSKATPTNSLPNSPPLSPILESAPSQDYFRLLKMYDMADKETLRANAILARYA